MRYRLIVADLDGTLMGEDVTISPAVLAAVGQVMAAGAYFTIATGRTLESALPHAQHLGVNAPAILYQGGEIRDLSAGKLIFQSTVPLDTAQDFIAAIAAVGLHLNVYLDGRVYAAARTPISEYYMALNGIQIEAVGDLPAFVTRPPSKMLIVAEPAQLDALAPLLRQQYAGRLQIVRSNPRFLEAIPLDANKGRGLERLAGYLGIAPAQTVAIGDNDNDAEMVAWAGLGIAMGNATPAVRAAARVIAPPVEEDGAAWAIQTLVLPARRRRETLDVGGAP